MQRSVQNPYRQPGLSSTGSTASKLASQKPFISFKTILVVFALLLSGLMLLYHEQSIHKTVNIRGNSLRGKDILTVYKSRDIIKDDHANEQDNSAEGTSLNSGFINKGSDIHNKVDMIIISTLPSKDPEVEETVTLSTEHTADSRATSSVSETAVDMIIISTLPFKDPEVEETVTLPTEHTADSHATSSVSKTAVEGPTIIVEVVKPIVSTAVAQVHVDESFEEHKKRNTKTSEEEILQTAKVSYHTNLNRSNSTISYSKLAPPSDLAILSISTRVIESTEETNNHLIASITPPVATTTELGSTYTVSEVKKIPEIVEPSNPASSSSRNAIAYKDGETACDYPGLDPFKSIPVDTFRPPVKASLQTIHDWEDKVDAMMKSITKMNVGGKVLRDFMQKEVRKMQQERFAMFCTYV